MDNILSPDDRQIMISAFLEIAIDQSGATAHAFLQAAKWRIEDAIQLFYVENEQWSATSSSHVPPVQSTTSLGYLNQSSIDAPVQMRVSEPPFIHVATDCIETGLVDFITRRRRRTRAEIAAATAGVIPDGPAELVTYRRRRSHFEMVGGTSSSMVIPKPGSTQFPTGPADLVIRWKRRTRAEIAATTASVISDQPAELVTYRRKQSHSEMATTPLSPNTTPSLLNYVPPASQMPCRQQLTRTQSRPTVSCEFPLSTQSGVKMSSKSKRTLLQLAAADYIPTSSNAPAIHKALGENLYKKGSWPCIIFYEKTYRVQNAYKRSGAYQTRRNQYYEQE